MLDGNAEDSSRNQFHASLRGTGGTFVEDGPPRRVLLLTGDGSHVQLPGDALAGEDTISITGWLFLPTGASGHVFDFGQNASNRLFGEATRTGFRAAIVTGGVVRSETAPRSVLENQWVHVAVVLDPASRVHTAYVDGARAGQAPAVGVTATQIVGQTAGATNARHHGGHDSRHAAAIAGDDPCRVPGQCGSGSREIRRRSASASPA